jgi:hypothetical protein
LTEDGGERAVSHRGAELPTARAGASVKTRACLKVIEKKNYSLPPSGIKTRAYSLNQPLYWINYSGSSVFWIRDSQPFVPCVPPVIFLQTVIPAQPKQSFFCAIRGSYRMDYEGYYLLECSPTFRTNVFPPSLGWETLCFLLAYLSAGLILRPWRWWQYVPPKRR